jgi:hypothetical protein
MTSNSNHSTMLENRLERMAVLCVHVRTNRTCAERCTCHDADRFYTTDTGTLGSTFYHHVVPFIDLENNTIDAQTYSQPPSPSAHAVSSEVGLLSNDGRRGSTSLAISGRKASPGTGVSGGVTWPRSCAEEWAADLLLRWYLYGDKIPRPLPPTDVRYGSKPLRISSFIRSCRSCALKSWGDDGMRSLSAD